MSLIFMGNKGMVTLEAVVLIIVVALGLLAMQRYLQRSIQAHWRTNADTFYDEQYDKDKSTETFGVTVNSQPAISVGLNPNPSFGSQGDYGSETHIGAFNAAVSSPAPMSTIDYRTDGATKILSVQDWQTCANKDECEGDDDN